ncbi:hypothetical protein MMYC01_208201 [Madurella mycetomatis]|uniref:Selenoprotein W n=1 Tax=Madurella mycetomatis TaxID=100816 RepID=A0A175VYS1_9PEZI|nr:hypothetical protein MMYC01_208201 [Madurella mycetomatis]
MAEIAGGPTEPRLPRITIQFCTQCKWMLRAAYYAQELLSTFSTSLGEVALQPATGGVFVVEIATLASASGEASTVVAADNDQPRQRRPAPAATVLWDRKVDGGFPETKELKRRVRDVIQPGRDLGHVDRDDGRGKGKGKRERRLRRKRETAKGRQERRREGKEEKYVMLGEGRSVTIANESERMEVGRNGDGRHERCGFDVEPTSIP